MGSRLSKQCGAREQNMNWNDFFNMGGYAFEVWTCWGLTTLVIVSLVILYKRGNAKIRQEIAREIRREQKFNNTK